ncbi:MAG: extracellular solute-binding protein [Butyribacter sp.]|nr:extracellular solute-binding protein [bacterium]MDY3854469.1 extracellular solute-binding protein [Butyribacter sp.]
MKKRIQKAAVLCAKKTLVLVSVCSLVLSLTGCSKGEKREQVKLTVWGSEESQDMMRQMADEFIESNQKQADIEISLGVEPEKTLPESVESNPKRAADIFWFADDQMVRLTTVDALLPITLHTDEVIEANGGEDSPSVQCAMEDGKLYAYPATASNGYFMFYNAKYFSDEDVKTLDGMLAVAEKKDKKLAMDWSSGWYISSFFKGAGLELYATEDGKANVCNWNATDTEYTGVDVAKAMLAISSSKAFTNIGDEEFREGIASNRIIAGVNGPWNASYIEKQWGEDYRAVKLPTYTLKGKQVQMASFRGCKLVGVNANTKYPEWAMRFAEWMTNYQNQLLRFELTGERPANIKAEKTEKVQSSQVAQALEAQEPYSDRQRVAESFWTPATAFGTVMAAGNLEGRDIQELLDELVNKTEEPVTEK